MIEFINGIPVFIPNTITKENKKEQFYISYNRSTRDYGVDTTALVIENEGKQFFYILKGNHTKEYEQCENLQDCFAYYKNNNELIHSYSDTVIPIELLN